MLRGKEYAILLELKLNTLLTYERTEERGKEEEEEEEEDEKQTKNERKTERKRVTTSHRSRIINCR